MSPFIQIVLLINLAEIILVNQMDVNLKLEQNVRRSNSELLKPILEEAKSNCRRLFSNWYPPITIEVLGAPPSTNPRHDTLSSLPTWTIEFAPRMLHNTLLLCKTRSIWGTDVDPIPKSPELKHTPDINFWSIITL